MKAVLSLQFRRIFAALLLLAMVAAASPALSQLYIEDFEDDGGLPIPGFATSIFNHQILGPNWFFVDDTPPLPIPPSLHHALFMGAQTTDLVTFALPPGQWVNYAGVWMTGTGGGAAGVSFLGTNGILTFTTTIQDQYQFFDTSAGGIGDIIGVMLGSPLPPDPPGPGQEALYDNIIINVVPEPGTWTMSLMALVAVGLLCRRARSR